MTPTKSKKGIQVFKKALKLTYLPCNNIKKASFTIFHWEDLNSILFKAIATWE